MKRQIVVVASTAVLLMLLTSSPALGSEDPIRWTTDVVQLEADSITIHAGGKVFDPAGQTVDVDSDPGTSTYWTLETTWHESGVEMRLFMYFSMSDGGTWWVDEIRAYNGKDPADWIYYRGPLLMTPAGQSYVGDVHLTAKGGSASLDITGLNLAVTPRTPRVAVRPGAWHGWDPFASGFVTGPAKPPLGVGSVKLKGSGPGSVEYDYETPPELSTFAASYSTYGAVPAAIAIITDAFVPQDGGPSQRLEAAPSGVSGWQRYDATGGTWQWDCDGDGTFDGEGSIADFSSGCNPTAKVITVSLWAKLGTTYVDRVEIGPGSWTTPYNMEPPLVKIRDARRIEGDAGKRAIRFRVSLSGYNGVSSRVRFATANGTAIAGKDYVAKTGVLKLGTIREERLITVYLLGDSRRERNESFKLKLSGPVNCAFGRRVATGTIVNDD